MKSKKAIDWRTVDCLIKLRDDSDGRTTRPRLRPDRRSDEKMIQSFTGGLTLESKEKKTRHLGVNPATKQSIDSFKITTISRGSLDRVLTDKRLPFTPAKEDFIKMVDSNLKLTESLSILKNQSLRSTSKAEQALLRLRIIDTVADHCEPAQQSLRHASDQIRKMLFVDGAGQSDISSYIKDKIMLGSMADGPKESPTLEFTGMLWQQAATLLYGLCKTFEVKIDAELKKYKYNERVYQDEIEATKAQITELKSVNANLENRLKTGYNEAQETIDNMRSEFILVKRDNQAAVQSLRDQVDSQQRAYQTLILEHGQEFKEVDKKFKEVLERKLTELEDAVEQIDTLTNMKNTAISKYKDVMVKLNEATCKIKLLREENRELSKQVENYQKITGVFENTDLTPRPDLTEIMHEMNLDLPTMGAIEENKFQTTDQRIRTMLGLIKVHVGLTKIVNKKTKPPNAAKR